MKIFLLFLIVFTIAVNASAQNLISNSSFEQHNACPNNEAEINNALDWENWCLTSDLFDSCSTSPLSSVPHNFAYGYQYPHSGNAYAGFFAYWTKVLSSGSNGAHDLLAQHLSQPLTIGQKYFVNFYVSLSLWTPTLCPCNRIGVKFTTSSFANYSWQFSSPLINNQCQFHEDTLISDTVNWTHLYGSFIADSAYQYIVFGNFFDNDHTDTVLMGPGQLCYSYFYLDDVCLSTDSLNCLATPVLQVDNSKQVQVYPNPFSAQCTIEIPFEFLSVALMNVYGEEVKASMSRTLHQRTTRIVLERNNLATGIYLLHIRTRQEDFLKQLVIQ